MGATQMFVNSKKVNVVSKIEKYVEKIETSVCVTFHFFRIKLQFSTLTN